MNAILEGINANTLRILIDFLGRSLEDDIPFMSLYPPVTDGPVPLTGFDLWNLGSFGECGVRHSIHSS
jgi:hypothetical protein